jgi:hypothetical protein
MLPIAQRRLDAVLAERAMVIEGRTAMKLPPPGAIAPMRRLAHELAAARGALNVGLAVAIETLKHPEIVGARIA